MEAQFSLHASDITFHVEGKEILFTLFHDIDKHGVLLETMLRHWLNHSKTYTAENFRDFLVATIPAIRCFTEDEGESRKYKE